MTNILKRGLESKQPIEIIYNDDSGNITQRIITIIAINDSHIKSYCHLRRTSRTFKKDNILSAAPHKKYSGSRRAI